MAKRNSNDARGAAKPLRIFPLIAAIYGVYSAIVFGISYTTTLDFSAMLPAIGLMWLLLGVFATTEVVFGMKSRVCTTPPGRLQPISLWGPFSTLFVSVLAAALTILSVTYYAGVGPGAVLDNLLNGQSLYLEYQEYNSLIAELGGSGVGRLFVILRLLAQLLTFYFFVTFVLIDRNLNWFRVASLVILGFASFYGSLARGTTFEAFKLLLLILFLLYMLGARSGTKLRGAVVATALAASVLYFFSFNVGARGVRQNQCLSLDVCPDLSVATNAFAAKIGEVSELLYGYFGHGFFYVGTMFRSAIFEDRQSFLSSFWPQGAFVASSSNFLDVVESTIDMGPRWRPDSAVLIANYGLFSLILTVAVLGLFAALLGRSFAPLGQIGLFIVFVQMVSFPVGNFVSVSIEYVAAGLISAAWLLGRGLWDKDGSAGDRDVGRPIAGDGYSTSLD